MASQTIIDEFSKQYSLFLKVHHLRSAMIVDASKTQTFIDCTQNNPRKIIYPHLNRFQHLYEPLMHCLSSLLPQSFHQKILKNPEMEDRDINKTVIKIPHWKVQNQKYNVSLFLGHNVIHQQILYQTFSLANDP